MVALDILSTEFDLLCSVFSYKSSLDQPVLLFSENAPILFVAPFSHTHGQYICEALTAMTRTNLATYKHVLLSVLVNDEMGLSD